jgi:predicted RNase H-like nuclease (RuvC/YqgF family)
MIDSAKGFLMDSTIVGATIGFFSALSIALILVIVSMARSKAKQELAFQEAINVLRAEISNLRDTLKDWTRALVEERISNERIDLRAWVRDQIRIQMSEHSSHCSHLRDDISTVRTLTPGKGVPIMKSEG